MKTTWSSFPRVFWYSVVVAALCSGLSLAWELVQPGSHSLALMGNYMIQPLGVFVSLAIGLSGKALHKHDDDSSRLRFAQRWVPVVYLLATLCPCLGILVVVYYSMVLHQTLPIPSLADFFGLVDYPLIILYYLLLPTNKLPSSGRPRRILDSVLILGSLTLFSWYFILGPLLLQGTGITPASITSSAYAVGTLVIIYYFIRMVMRSSDASTRPTILLFACSVLSGSISISIYAYLSIRHAYTSGGVVDWGLQASYILFGLATQALRLAPYPQAVETKNSFQEERPLISSTWTTLLPYVLLLLIITLTIYSWRNGANSLREIVIYIGCMILILLSFLRQLVVVREITVYARMTAHLNEALAEANRRLEVLSITDPLTKLLNHGALLVCLEQEIERARRYGHSLALLFFDGDHFKEINDTHGHSIGDAVLCELGSRVQTILRSGDIVGRYGGEEFVVLLPETDLVAARDIAERLRLVIAAQPLASELVEGGLEATISIGIATFPIDGQTASEVLNLADQAMYWAKRLGRNQIQTVLDVPHVGQEDHPPSISLMKAHERY